MRICTTAGVLRCVPCAHSHLKTPQKTKKCVYVDGVVRRMMIRQSPSFPHRVRRHLHPAFTTHQVSSVPFTSCPAKPPFTVPSSNTDAGNVVCFCDAGMFWDSSSMACANCAANSFADTDVMDPMWTEQRMFALAVLCYPQVYTCFHACVHVCRGSHPPCCHCALLHILHRLITSHAMLLGAFPSMCTCACGGGHTQ